MDDLVIHTHGLRKHFGPNVAVADLTLAVPRGEVFGFLGPNGAGKSTALKMLLGLVTPSAGEARVLGRPPGSRQALREIGFLPEHFRFHEWLHAEELLDLHGRLYGMDAAARRRRIPQVLELVGLADQARRPIAGFSKGMLQRIGLAQAFLNEPKLVFLDEPTSALDPFGRMLVRTIIHELKQQGTTVFLNSHLLGEVEATCDRVAFIRAGTVLDTQVLTDLGAGGLRVEVRVDVVTPALTQSLDELVRRTDGAMIPWCPPGVAAGTTLMYDILDEALLPEIAERTIRSGARLYGLTSLRRSLEQIFLDIVGAEDSGK
ncbi:MAG: ABC transporter ATP-binding protein [Blastochloris sp.]|nr:ABC transporter ATP-binding protein [Blastochloris sp.]